MTEAGLGSWTLWGFLSTSSPSGSQLEFGIHWLASARSHSHIEVSSQVPRLPGNRRTAAVTPGTAGYLVARFPAQSQTMGGGDTYLGLEDPSLSMISSLHFPHPALDPFLPSYSLSSLSIR